jgi:hypothetical protein
MIRNGYGGIVTPAIHYAEHNPLTGLEGRLRISWRISRTIRPAVHAGAPACCPGPTRPGSRSGRSPPGERNLRPAARILGALLALDPAQVTAARPTGQRVFGTCRHFTPLSCVFLRYEGIAVRIRCGFATYFQAELRPRPLGHRVSGRRWPLGENRCGDPHRHGPGPCRSPRPASEFLARGEARAAFRRWCSSAAKLPFAAGAALLCVILYGRCPSCSTDSRWRPSSTNPAFW